MAEVRGAPVFTGQYEHQIDEANRVVMPAKLRDKLAGPLFVSIGQGDRPHLVLFPATSYQLILEKFADLDPLDVKQDSVRDIFANGDEIALDGQGRLRVPAELRKAAKLGQRVMVLGAFNRVEVWDYETYKAYRDERLSLSDKE